MKEGSYFANISKNSKFKLGIQASKSRALSMCLCDMIRCKLIPLI